MTRHRARQLPASIAAVALIAQQAQNTTGRTMPQAEICELITEARQIQFRHMVEQPHIPPVGHITWSPQAYAATHPIHGLTPELFTEVATALQQALHDVPW